MGNGKAEGGKPQEHNEGGKWEVGRRKAENLWSTMKGEMGRRKVESLWSTMKGEMGRRKVESLWSTMMGGNGKAEGGKPLEYNEGGNGKAEGGKPLEHNFPPSAFRLSTFDFRLPPSDLEGPKNHTPEWLFGAVHPLH
ncbi:MAG: hypothetical protein R2828_35135 [Saprospiraceae bacterium]